jgi:hypothetical protein
LTVGASPLALALELAGDGRARFVFPSEVAAASALAWVLAASGRHALPCDRFMGWDAFKSSVFAGDGRGRPSTKAIRTIFARLLAAENARAPFLCSVVPPGVAAASTRFTASIASALPALRAVPDGPGGHLADWREIRLRYGQFMADHGLYEAAWLGREAGEIKDRWVLFHPDLTEDWDDYSPAVLALPGVRVVLSGELGAEPVPVAGFGTLVEELRAVLLSIRTEVASGTDPAGICISVASPETVLPVLEREARIAGVPLDEREGRPLSESAGGRLLADVAALHGSRMSFASLRRLLLDESRPWKEAAAARRLLDTGIRKHVVAPLPDGPDIWEASIGSDDEVRRLYRGLRTASARIATAAGFRSLRSAFDSFRHAFIDESAWSRRQNDEIARCLAVLDELDEATIAAGIDADGIPGAAETLMDQLKDTRYLPVSESGGIAVYRFPVAAGGMPDLHYVVNLSEGSATAAARPLSFMRADERDRAGASDRDISAGLVRLLAISGKRVFMSCSADGPDGVRPPHPAVEPLEPVRAGLPYDRELWLPNREADAPPIVFPIQAASAGAALATVFGPDCADWSTGIPESPVTMGKSATAALLASQSSGGRLRLSATAIEGYASCAFRRVYARQLKVEAVESGLSFIDNLLIGTIYHDAFSRLLEPLAKAGIPVVSAADGNDGDGPAAGETARPSGEEVRSAIAEAISAIGRDRGPMAGVLVQTATPVLGKMFSAAAASLLSAIDGLVPVLVDEVELSAPLPTLDAELYGRPDLVCVRPGDSGRPRAVIVDYKKSKIPARAELAPDETGTISAIQIPAYTVLVAAAGYEPEAAWYLSVEGSGPSGKGLRLVFGPGDKPCIDAGGMSLLEPALTAAAAKAAATIRSGSVYIPAHRDREAVCVQCDLRPVCRAHYTVR